MEDLLVIKVSSERVDHHTIKYVTSNSQKFLKWAPTRLLGNDLNQILPDPLTQYHSDLWKPNIQSGNLLRKSKMLDIYVKQYSGFITPAKFSVRIDSALSKGLSYVGFLNFNKSPEHNKSGMITTLDGAVTGITPDLQNLFTVGDSTFEINDELQKVYES
jgi:hypothetical protein